MLLRILKVPLLLTGMALLGTLLVGGLQTAIIVTILAILEISLSFDNAVVNAKVLSQMSEFWQKMFLTVGIAIAVFGMRLVFPLAVVSIAGNINPFKVVDLALVHPDKYASILSSAHPAIAAFGGISLLMIFLDWLFEAREIRWLKPIEDFMGRIGKVDYLAVILVLLVLGVSSLTIGHAHEAQILSAGVFGLIAYLAVSSLSNLFDEGGTVAKVGKAGFVSFLYLELLDASFSFDGVTGAFAVTDEIFLIALGLGIGALYIRSLTVYLVRKGTLKDYVYLEHGAHYAIGALALLLFASVAHEIPEIVTGMIGVGFILASFIHSVIKLKDTNIDRQRIQRAKAQT
jgi:hypothetical protein